MLLLSAAGPSRQVVDLARSCLPGADVPVGDAVVLFPCAPPAPWPGCAAAALRPPPVPLEPRLHAALGPCAALARPPAPARAPVLEWAVLQWTAARAHAGAAFGALPDPLAPAAAALPYAAPPLLAQDRDAPEGAGGGGSGPPEELVVQLHDWRTAPDGPRGGGLPQGTQPLLHGVAQQLYHLCFAALAKPQRAPCHFQALLAYAALCTAVDAG